MNWNLEDFAIVLILDKNAIGELLSKMLANAASDLTIEPPFSDDAEAPPAASGIQNVPPANAPPDQLDAMGVKDPPTKAVSDAAELTKRAKYYDNVQKQKAQGK